jgi:hypothetical protein
MPLLQTIGNAAADTYGGISFAPVINYVENVFSPYLYIGNGSSQTITNGLNLSGNGGLVWMKGRSGATDHALYDTNRGATFDLVSNSTAAQTTQATGLTSFNTTGFSIGALAKLNTSSATYVGWTFRKQAKFFDVVTYTGTGANTTIPHNLGSVPGMIIVKRTDAVSQWTVYHVGFGNTGGLSLNTNAAAVTTSAYWNNTTPTGSVFSIGTDNGVNTSGGSYAAYLFASNAGGFGLTGTDNVITCGTFTTDASGNATVTLGYEPQYLLLKNSLSVENWFVLDSARGWDMGTGDRSLSFNLNAAESGLSQGNPTATGFTAALTASSTYIYMAIRKGPMAVPTSPTQVYDLALDSAITTTHTVTSAIVPDVVLQVGRVSTTGHSFASRLTPPLLVTSAAGTESPPGYNYSIGTANQIGLLTTTGTGTTGVNSFLKRAPGFMDVVAYTGIGTTPQNIAHNLTVTPELIIVKSRSSGYSWFVYSSYFISSTSRYLRLNFTDAVAVSSTVWNNTAATSSVFSVGNAADVNNVGSTYVAYLFASLAGISKVGSYTGNGTTQTIDCGFPAGVRFVLIKRTDVAGNWVTFDTARGMVSGTDPFSQLNTTASETNANNVFTVATGFQLASSLADINASGGSYVFLALA